MKRSAPVVLLAFCSLLVIGCVALVCVSPHPFIGDAIDFRSFYCATRAILTGHSPYLAEPLRTCENITAVQAGSAPLAPGLALPAPLAGYAFALFMPLAPLPYVWANLLYDGLLLTATIVSAIMLAKMTAIPPVVVVVTLVIGEAFQSLRFGQIVPIALALLVLAALLIEQQRTWLAALALGAALIEPHVSAPVAIALFLFVPRMRLPTLVVGVALAAISLAILGLTQNLFYFTRVLPAQVHSEITMNSYQYSLTNLLHQAGVPDSTALFLGDASYIAMIAAGLVVSWMLARHTGRQAYFVFGPCAFALVGGPYLHLVHIVCALPLALLLLRSFPGDERTLTALALLAPPWLELARVGDPWLVGALSAAIVYPISRYVLPAGSARPWSVAAGCAFLGALLAFVWQWHAPSPHDATSALRSVSGGGLLAETSWETYVHVVVSGNQARYLLAKAPTWCGLLLLAGAAAMHATRRPRTQATPA
ncbi:MAG TPA: glycosyltransferase 87 family protein [Candidatus Baltobacteraceae bacterium]